MLPRTPPRTPPHTARTDRRARRRTRRHAGSGEHSHDRPSSGKIEDSASALRQQAILAEAVKSSAHSSGGLAHLSKGVKN